MIKSNWAKRFMGLAEQIASWSKDPSTKCGALLVRPDLTIASVGFNGFPRGVNDDISRLNNRDIKLQYTVHAELNCILSAKTKETGCCLFVWPMQPCASCAAAIVQYGIATVYSPKNEPKGWEDSFKISRKILSEGNVRLVRKT